MLEIIKVRRLTKTYPIDKSREKLRAVDGIDFSVRHGELFGFLGPNGAGKTTTINMLTGLARPDSGEIIIADLDCSGNPKAAQHLIGVVPDESNLYPELSGFDNLCFCASLHGMPSDERKDHARDLLVRFGLEDAADRKFEGYSRGMKRKLTIAAGIIHRPQILFLDEPTTGIDVASARQIRRHIADLHTDGTTIFLTTHYIEEAERLCERIAFIVRGQIVRVDSVANLLQPVQQRKAILISVSDTTGNLHGELAAAFPHLEFQTVSEERIRVESEATINIAPLIRLIEDLGVEVTEARQLRLSLEDVFVNVTGLELDAMRKEKEKGGRGA
jgi:ABC-2 type transport system ATP-binding protein